MPPLRVHAASSIVKSLAGLEIYLANHAISGDYVVIDEPEMNAHPDGQLAIAEWLCMLANKGLRIIITTHSPYITDHINNLVKLAGLPVAQQKMLEGKLSLHNLNAAISPDIVGMYLFNRDGEVESLYDDKSKSFDLSTFGDSSNKVSNLFSDILRAERGGPQDAV